ncbi:MAG TPA: isochorismatase family protein [Candidatus Limnocylindrales bacterium]
MDWAVVPERTALINVDLQRCFVESLDDPQPLLDRINRLSAASREAGILVIHTRHVVLSDGTATAAGPEYQNLTLDILDGLFAQVLTVDELIAKVTATQTEAQA